jgi:hypothetical protein
MPRDFRSAMLVAVGLDRAAPRNYFNPRFLSQLWRLASVVW